MDLLRQQAQSQGFTLVEVMIALVILAIGLLGLAGLQIVSTQSNSFSNQMTVATTIAQDRLEALRNLDYSHSDLDADTHQDPANPLKAPGDMGFYFDRSWTVTEDATNNIKTIEVTVEWPHPDNSHSVQFTTVKSQ